MFFVIFSSLPEHNRNNLEISSHILAFSYSGENRNMFGERKVERKVDQSSKWLRPIISGLMATLDLGGRKTGYFQLT